ncbi:MAG: sel1 repeat family protein, partial [Opitutaceae bacterium]|nr:sel1 repeat family protein [Verrucomicrobiales bacterium]
MNYQPSGFRVAFVKSTISFLWLVASLLWVVRPAIHAQPTDALRQEFLAYKAQAENGEAKAQSNLGVCYAKGEGVEKDYREAVKWFRKAADQNFALAQFNLATCYETGQGVGKDY